MFALRRLPRASAPALRSFSTTSTRSSFAKISIIGHLAATPEVHATSTGLELVKYAVATNSGPKENRTTSWWNVASFAPEGAFRDILTSLPKGAMVYVEGDATMNTYVDSEGKNRNALKIVERKLSPSMASPMLILLSGKLEILKRPDDSHAS